MQPGRSKTASEYSYGTPRPHILPYFRVIAENDPEENIRAIFDGKLIISVAEKINPIIRNGVN